jgi:hypothetical protein
MRDVASSYDEMVQRGRAEQGRLSWPSDLVTTTHQWWWSS